MLNIEKEASEDIGELLGRENVQRLEIMRRM